MNEKELTENAAKAFGLRGFISDHRDCREFVVAGPTPVIFSPLKDDGDALRLAVKFCFTIEQWQNSVEIKIGDEVIHRELADGLVTRLELTRRAITRAAAAMAR